MPVLPVNREGPKAHHPQWGGGTRGRKGEKLGRTKGGRAKKFRVRQRRKWPRSGEGRTCGREGRKIGRGGGRPVGETPPPGTKVWSGGAPIVSPENFCFSLSGPRGKGGFVPPGGDPGRGNQPKGGAKGGAGNVFFFSRAEEKHEAPKKPGGTRRGWAQGEGIRGSFRRFFNTGGLQGTEDFSPPAKISMVGWKKGKRFLENAPGNLGKGGGGVTGKEGAGAGKEGKGGPGLPGIFGWFFKRRRGGGGARVWRIFLGAFWAFFPRGPPGGNGGGERGAFGRGAPGLSSCLIFPGSAGGKGDPRLETGRGTQKAEGPPSGGGGTTGIPGFA